MPNSPKPSWFLYITELARTVIDITRGLFFKWSHKRQHRANPHPVMVVPGFLGSDLSTFFLRKFIADLGYPVQKWGLGRNLADLNDLTLLAQKLAALHAQYQQKVTLIGWSLGGVYVRELAKQNPEAVRQVITMGSPFKNIEAPNHARWIFDLIGKKNQLDPAFIAKLPAPAPVPTVAIYTKQDGVVAWTTCMETPSALHRNVEVWGSHCGLVFNPQVCQVIEESLA
ncbi:MAG: alpha/beta hydrolase [Runella slithyformis]|nr:MAG: alpha/beta hydrolase [Runella slithyformis]TAF03106.1 MAG: alpha/beta hydrolase [Runella slithyformis]TAF24710.1 MAG: alpha/beta hydrolase [Runella slithyformis]TAF49570.1 MAG: alpha/beta hydrolase [Runella slithyformis]TAF79377.1 MAG: alpha/beta hydrolase [Runella slithyformis]